jgi:hypothetical protein
MTRLTPKERDALLALDRGEQVKNRSLLERLWRRCLVHYMTENNRVTSASLSPHGRKAAEALR